MEPLKLNLKGNVVVVKVRKIKYRTEKRKFIMLKVMLKNV